MGGAAYDGDLAGGGPAGANARTGGGAVPGDPRTGGALTGADSTVGGAARGAAAEMIFSGDELLRGDTLNTNQTYLGERLLDLGIFATHALCVTDDLAAMVEAIRASLARRPLVLVLSGGLGPTDGRSHPRGRRGGPWPAAGAARRPARSDHGAVRLSGLRHGRHQPQTGPHPPRRLRHPPRRHGAGFPRPAGRYPGGRSARRALGAQADVGRERGAAAARAGGGAGHRRRRDLPEPRRSAHPHLRHR